MSSRGPKDEKSVEVGEVDPMSKGAAAARVTLCEEKKGSYLCTRALGHDESNPGHASALHVAAGTKYVAKKVWS